MGTEQLMCEFGVRHGLPSFPSTHTAKRARCSGGGGDQKKPSSVMSSKNQLIGPRVSWGAPEGRELAAREAVQTLSGRSVPSGAGPALTTADRLSLSPGRAAYLPMTAFGSVPKAQMHGEPEGTWNLEKLHLELKYFGRKLADAKL